MKLKSAKRSIPVLHTQILVEYLGTIWLGRRIKYSSYALDRKYDGRYELFDYQGCKRNVWKHDRIKYKYI